ncbi:MAG: UDP-N-acetylglucosamine 4,6-dehydratase (inverting) [Methanoregula sp.]|nr:UDP-N-acetylglucosamine 4,6-dehydratase (inverting) [Methanoregula sp.]
MPSCFDGKTILVTGGTGSFGQKFTEILLKECSPKSIRIYSRGELMQSQMSQRFTSPRMSFLIGDVRDRSRLYRAMNGVDIVVHAAAMKQVPACEYNPIEAVKTNIEGTINLIDAAVDNNVNKVMLISTDKAVHPVNLYGATKMVAEKLGIQGNSYSGGKIPWFSCVRYGNVIGSRGSVIPLFKEQQKKGVITITDEKMTRFWISLDQGVRFVMNSIEIMNGGEIFIPKIPSMRLTDLADAIAPNVKKEYMGIRAGEKLHEVLLTEDEARHAKEYDHGFVIEPEHRFWNQNNGGRGKVLPEGFRYASDTNTVWLSNEDLKKIIAMDESTKNE